LSNEPVGGRFQLGKVNLYDCIGEAQRDEILAHIEQVSYPVEEVRKKLRGTAKQKLVNDGMVLPMKQSADSPIEHGFAISNFVDHNSEAPGDQYSDSNTDYNCGNRSYDLASGYNHSGIDYSLWPFDFWQMNNNYAQVVAALPGVIVAKHDNNPDENCGNFIPGASWNAVFVQHEDNSVAWYGHMKSGSLTSKEVGDVVSSGEFLGVVGSSGQSTGPHLHLELRSDPTSSSTTIDPYYGACNPTISSSKWVDQTPYKKPTINAVFTHSSAPEPSCSGSDINQDPKIKTSFIEGEVAYMAVYLRDQIPDERLKLTLRRPNGTVAFMSDLVTKNFFSGSYWWWTYRFSSDDISGVYTVEFEYVDEILTSDLTYSNSEAPLPVEVTAVSASVIGNQSVLVEFSTASAVNVDYFAVERLTDEYWIVVDTIKVTQDYQEVRHFQVEDIPPFTDTRSWYYRVVSHDYDGSKQTSSVVTAELTQTFRQLTVSPNPLNGSFLKLSGISPDAKILLVSSAGHEREMWLNNGGITVDGLSSGIYSIRSIDVDGSIGFARFMVSR